MFRGNRQSHRLRWPARRPHHGAATAAAARGQRSGASACFWRSVRCGSTINGADTTDSPYRRMMALNGAETLKARTLAHQRRRRNSRHHAARGRAVAGASPRGVAGALARTRARAVGLLVRIGKRQPRAVARHLARLGARHRQAFLPGPRGRPRPASACCTTSMSGRGKRRSRTPQQVSIGRRVGTAWHPTRGAGLRQLRTRRTVRAR